MSASRENMGLHQMNQLTYHATSLARDVGMVDSSQSAGKEHFVSETKFS